MRPIAASWTICASASLAVISDGAYLRLVHDYRVAPDMGAALRVAYRSGIEHLLGVILATGAETICALEFFAV